MKFNKHYHILFLQLLIHTYCGKECEMLLSENRVKCILNSETSTSVTAAEDNRGNNAEGNKGHYYKYPINTCTNENCEFCCLSTNKCGNPIQCHNSLLYRPILLYIYLGIVSVLGIVMIIKFMRIDGHPVQSNEEKINSNDLKDLIKIFKIIKSKKKTIVS